MDPCSIVSNTVSNISTLNDYVITPIKPYVTRPFNYKRKLEELKNEVDKLKSARQKVEELTKDAEYRIGQDIKEDVTAWLGEAQSQISADEARQVEERERAKKKCFMGLCPNFITRYQISRNAEKEAGATVQLLGKSSEFDTIDKISCRPAAEATRPVTMEDYEAFESRKSYVKEIKDALTAAEGNMIGVWGLGGVGKTTLVKEVARQAMEDKLIDKVVIVEVTEKPDIAKIQEKIAEQLDFKLDEQSEKASRLRTRLTKEAKLLIILDNLWDKLDLKEVGIPFASEHKGCRILMTSRDEDVLSSMGAETRFSLQVLNDPEACDLFMKKAGDVDKDIESVAAQVAEECAGLPVLLVAVASALKGKDLQTWKDALERLKRFDNKEYSTLRLSYDMLKGDEIKSLFLLCGQLGFKETPVCCLLNYTMGLGLLKYCNTLEKTRNRLHVLVNKLKACCLLQEADWKSYDAVKMHDVVRKFAVSVATEGDRVLTVEEGSKLEAWPEKNKFKQYTAISLRLCEIPELPTALECPRLQSFLLIHRGTPSLKIADNFFGGMRKLKLMDLTRVHLSPLPLSVKYLENLQTLCLDECTLDDISVVGLLTNLQVLSMIGSSLVQLPKEIGQLTQLKLLDLRDCTSLEVIAPDVLSRLTTLEDLYMGNSFKKWEVERPVSQRSNASLAELKQLKNLITLDIHVTDAKMLPKDLFFNKLERFRLFIGKGWDWDGKYQAPTLKLNLNARTQLGEGLKMLLKRTEDLYLDGVEGLSNVVYELDMEGFHQLKHLNIQHCHEIQHIINSYGMGPLIAFPRLKLLAIENLSNLKEICHGQLMTKSFKNLRVLKVRNCERLKYLISFSVARSLPQLEEIGVTDCEVMDVIVAEEADDHLSRDSNIEWAGLRSLALQSLPQFTSFCSKVKPPSHHNTSTIDNRPGTSRQLSNQKILFPNLEELRLSSLQVEKVWDRQLVDLSSCSEKLTDLIVEGCDNLNHLFTFSMFKSLVRLQKLEIRHCKSMKEIIAIDRLGGEEEREKICAVEVDKCGSLSGKGAGTDYKILFPALKMITLESLPSLTSFYMGKGILEFSSLESVRIENCPNMKSFVYNDDAAVGSSAPLFTDKVVFPKLESLLVTDCESLVELFDTNSEPLTQLRTFSVGRLPNLKSLFPASMARGLVHLEELAVASCGIEEIVQIEEGIKEMIKFEFPRLKHMELWRLPELQRFYPGPHSSECLALKELIVYSCDKVETFSWESILGSDGCSEGQNQISLEQPLFLAEKIVPNLETLPLSSKDAAMICQNKYPPHLFHKTKALALQFFHGESTEFPMALLKRYFSNLETLVVVINSKFKESSPQELGIENENQAIVFKQLRYLSLIGVHNLSQFWKQDSELGGVLQNLETLNITACDSLIDLSPFSASFQSLTTLEVDACDGTVNLLTPSMATSLVQLTEMTIRECDAVISVVANEGDESKDEIVFSKLESLTLDCLPRLISFCPENLSLKFPSLLEVNFSQCPEMRTFSGGDVGTPKLQEMRLIGADGQVQWHGDLNTYVQQLYSELGDAVADSVLPSSPKAPTAQLEKKGSLVVSESRKAAHWGVIQKKASIRDRILDIESANQFEPDKENIESALPESTIDRLDAKYEDPKEISKDKDDPTYARDGGEDESDDNPLMGKDKVGDPTEGTTPSEIVKEEAMQLEIALEPNSAASQTSIEGNELEVNKVVVGVSETENIITHIDDDEMTTAPLAVGETSSTNDVEVQSRGIDFVSFSNVWKATDTPPEILVAPPNAGAHLNVEASNYSLSSTSTTIPQAQDDNVVKEETTATPSQTRSGVMTITTKSVTVVASKPNMSEVVRSKQEVITAPRGEVEATEEAVLMTASPTATEAATDGSIVVMGTEPKEEKFPATASQTCTGVAMTTRRIVPLTAKPSMPEEVETREEEVPVTTSATEEPATNGGTIVMATEPMILAFSQSVDSGSASPEITSEATQEADEALSQDQVASFVADLLASKSIAAENADVSSRSEIARRLVGLADQLQQDHQNCSNADELLSDIADLRSSDVTAAQHALLSRIKRSLEDRTQDREDAAKALKQLENRVKEAQVVQKQSISIFLQQEARKLEANLEHVKLSAEVQALAEEITKLEAQRMQKLMRIEALDQEKEAN